MDLSGVFVNCRKTMPDFNSLAALRKGLTADDPDQRASAYSSVLNADVQPSQVLESSPAESVTQSLVEAGVVPEDTTSTQRGANQQREEIISLLEAIAGNTGGA